MSRPKKPYSIGYRKPPEGQRFQPGKSGNPLGRPRVKVKVATIYPVIKCPHCRQLIEVSNATGKFETTSADSKGV